MVPTGRRRILSWVSTDPAPHPMSDERWECWADHQEDLTERVRAARTAGRPWVFRSVRGLLGRGGPPRPIVVTCSEGHENVIELGGGA